MTTDDDTPHGSEDPRKADPVIDSEEITKDIAEGSTEGADEHGRDDAHSSEDANPVAAETAEGQNKKSAATADSDHDEADATNTSVWARNGWTWVAAVIAILAVAGAVVGYAKYSSTTDELAAMRKTQSEREAVIKVATDYAMKSLTYTFQDPDAFFRSVEGGVSPVLKDKYVDAQELLKAIMTQAQVTSSGEVLATDATAQPGDVYQVTVTANQTVRNLQNPEPRVSNIVLQITVNKLGDTWQVSDIGPRAGSRGPNTDLKPPPAPPGPLPSPPTHRR